MNELRGQQSSPDQSQDIGTSQDVAAAPAAAMPELEGTQPNASIPDQLEGDDAAGLQPADLDPYMNADVDPYMNASNGQDEDVETFSQASDYAMALWVKGLGADAERSGDCTPTEPESPAEAHDKHQDMEKLETPRASNNCGKNDECQAHVTLCHVSMSCMHVMCKNYASYRTMCMSHLGRLRRWQMRMPVTPPLAA